GGGQRGRLRAQHRQPHQEPARQAAPGGTGRRADPDPSRPGLQPEAGVMPLGVRIFLVYFLFVGLAGWFVLSTVMDEIRPGVRQSTEETLVDTANLLAEILRDDLRDGRLQQG